MIPKRFELRWRDGAGLARVLDLPIAPDAARASARQEATRGSARDDAIEVALRIERAGDEAIVRATLVNRGDAPIALDSAIFGVATGLPSDRPARFFKHGYQSWSNSRPIGVGRDRPHYRDQKPELVRLIHQSETTRPPEFPDVATSEMFTIVESGGERVLAGFVGGASQLTTITISTPDEISARAMLDGATLAPGAECEIEPLMIIRADQPAARLAARWASKTGTEMHARVGAPYQRGWCSWYHYFHGITEAAFRSNLQALAEMRAEFPIEVVQLDDGFQSALGDWDTTNAKFPSGLKRLADEIRAAGFEAGIWTAPFLAARDSQIMNAHPEWFLRDPGGEPLKAGYNTNWTTHQDGFAYALDPTHPDFTAHLSRLFEKLTAEFGYSYLKLDFLYAAAAQGTRHDRRLTRAQAIRRGLEAIRAGAGERAFILGCGCPLGPAIGIVDGMRIGEDVSPGWTTGTRQAIDAIVARSFMHRRLWLNDPDCLMLRQRETSLTANERGALAAAIAVSGGMLLLSDDMSLLGSAEAALFRSVAKLGAEVDADSAGAPALPLDLMEEGPVRVLKKEMPGYALAMILNRGDEPERVTVHDPELEPEDVRIVSLEGVEDDAPASIELAPHSAAIVRMRR
ncbi:MAG: glycoside hydrolase family 36 protein [Candidatus Binatales bacterium]